MIGLNLALRAVGIGLAAGAGLWAARRATNLMRWYSFRNKVVVITGGSRGLGLTIARRLAEEKAHLVVLARDREELQRAQADLERFNGMVVTMVCDITDQACVQRVVADVFRRFARIDVLINNAGVIQAGPMETMTLKDFEEAMDTHLYGHLYLTLCVVPHMKRAGEGRIVNIASIGGKISVPHLLPYCTSKFALVGFSEGLRAELLKDNVFVTTVCPGLMRTGSHVNAYFKGNNKAEFALFAMANANPLSSVDGDEAAEQIVDACRAGEAELVISPSAKIAAMIHGVVPGLVTDVMGLVNMVLPGPGGIGTSRVKGRESASALAPSPLTLLADLKVRKNNEL